MKLAVIGYGEFALEVKELAERINSSEHRWDSVFFVDKSSNVKDEVISEADFFENSEFDKENIECVVAVGEPALREKLYKKYKQEGFSFATLVDPTVVLSSSAKVEEGCIVLPFVYIAHDAHIGVNTILHTHSMIENDVSIGEHCFISLGAFIGAGTKAENNSFVGPNASVRDAIHIAKYSVVGMGSVVTKDVEQESVLIGNPAKKIRNNNTHIVGFTGRNRTL